MASRFCPQHHSILRIARRRVLCQRSLFSSSSSASSSWGELLAAERPSWTQEWKNLGLGCQLVDKNEDTYISNLFFVQMGFGVDQHGDSDATKAALRAVRNAIEFNSIPGAIEAIPGGRKEMLIEINRLFPATASPLGIILIHVIQASSIVGLLSSLLLHLLPLQKDGSELLAPVEADVLKVTNMLDQKVVGPTNAEVDNVKARIDQVNEDDAVFEDDSEEDSDDEEDSEHWDNFEDEEDSEDEEDPEDEEDSEDEEDPEDEEDSEDEGESEDWDDSEDEDDFEDEDDENDDGCDHDHKGV